MRQLRFSEWELPALVEKSISFIQKNEPSGGFFLGFSGGKDSIVTLELAKMSGVRFVAGYNFTGIDHPEVVKMIRHKYPEVHIIHPRKTFWELLKKKPPPKRTMRWCCSQLKETGTLGYKHLIMGIRAEESVARASRGQISENKGKITFKPIFHWPEWAVWEFIRKHSLPYPSLYDEGFHRVGCVICPFFCGPSKNQARLRDMSRERYPLVWKLHEKCVRYWWEHRQKKPEDRYSDFDDFYSDYWVS